MGNEPTSNDPIAVAHDLARDLVRHGGAAGVLLGGSLGTKVRDGVPVAGARDIDLYAYFDSGQAAYLPVLLVMAVRAVAPPGSRSGSPGLGLPGPMHLLHAAAELADCATPFEYAGQPIDLIARSLDRIEHLVEGIDGTWCTAHVPAGVAGAIHETRFLAELHAGAILEDPSGRLASLVARTRAYPAALLERIEDHALVAASDYLRWAEGAARRGDRFHASLCLHHFVSTMLQLLHARAGIYWSGEKKAIERAAALPLAPVDLAATCLSIAGDGDQALSFEARVALARDLYASML